MRIPNDVCSMLCEGTANPGLQDASGGLRRGGGILWSDISLALQPNKALSTGVTAQGEPAAC